MAAANTRGFTGFTTSIRSYSRVEGILLRPAEAVVRYGTLVRVHDSSTEATYLAMITDVKEETPQPALDVDRLRKLFEGLMAGSASLEDAVRVLEEITSPTQELVKWSSIMTVELTVLGEVRRGSLEPYDRPPRPFSRISYPDPKWLESLLHSRFTGDYREQGLYVGRLSYNPEVEVYMIPQRLTTHLSILGQTGAGKTETVKRLVFEVSRRRHAIKYPKGGIVVFDVAGEYTGYPYNREDTVPLLDAVVEPQKYAPEPPYHTPEKVTVIVPYEASRAAGAGWEGLVEGARDLACTLARRLSRSVDVAVFLEYERLTGMLDPECGGSLSKASYRDAYNLIKASMFAVTALPLPGFMDVDSMVELSGTRSEYFPILVSAIASALDLFHGEDVYGIRLLLNIVESWLNAALPTKASQDLDTYRKKGREAGPPEPLRAFKEYCQSPRDSESEERLQNKLEDSFGLPERGRSLQFPMQRYLAWLAYRHGYADPAKHSEWAAACRLLSSPEGERLVSERFVSLYRVVRAMSKVSAATLASAARALKKLDILTSDVFDTVIFDLVMERLMTGFSIVHLAPPSTGGVDVLLATLIRRLFQLHVGRYDPERLTVIVAEEAHNLAPSGVERASKQALLRVAREGRKWGLSLWLVTQRPAFVDSGVLSQAATSILLRTTNPDDLSTVKRGVESVAAEVADRLPDLEPTRGEALLVGLAAPERRVPLLVMVDRLSPVVAER